MQRQFVAYYRVSTHEQGKSGLGLEAQRVAVASYLHSSSGVLLAEYTDIESGKRDDRPELARALANTKKVKGTLVIAKLDRLSRKVSFVSSLMDAGVRFVAVDNPSANELTIHILAAVAQAERKAIGERTKAALAAAKLRGRILGNPRLADVRPLAVKAACDQADSFAANVLPTIRHLQASGCRSLRSIAEVLNARGILSSRGNQWTPMGVLRILQRRSRSDMRLA
jgi:DNA invertase Pin-like site-specific DNA recombinase